MPCGLALPEIGQILHNNPVGYSTSDFIEALIDKVRDKTSLACWNVLQKNWSLYRRRSL